MEHVRSRDLAHAPAELTLIACLFGPLASCSIDACLRRVLPACALRTVGLVWSSHGAASGFVEVCGKVMKDGAIDLFVARDFGDDFGTLCNRARGVVVFFFFVFFLHSPSSPRPPRPRRLVPLHTAPFGCCGVVLVVCPNACSPFLQTWVFTTSCARSRARISSGTCSSEHTTAKECRAARRSRITTTSHPRQVAREQRRAIEPPHGV